MSGQEFGDEAVRESRSSVKISTNAKGEAQVEVKGYSHDLDSLEETRQAVIAAYIATMAQVRP